MGAEGVSGRIAEWQKLLSHCSVFLGCYPLEFQEKQSRGLQLPRLPHRHEGRQVRCGRKFGVRVNSNAGFICTNIIKTHQCVCVNYWLALSKDVEDVANAAAQCLTRRNSLELQSRRLETDSQTCVFSALFSPIWQLY